MLRLDFEQFVIEGVTAFDDTGVCTDSFAVTTVSKAPKPKLEKTLITNTATFFRA